MQCELSVRVQRTKLHAFKCIWVVSLRRYLTQRYLAQVCRPRSSQGVFGCVWVCFGVLVRGFRGRAGQIGAKLVPALSRQRHIDSGYCV